MTNTPPPAFNGPAGSPTGLLPPGIAVASPWVRFGSYVLEGLLAIVTLGIGWLIWASMTAGTGQTPAKKLLHLRVIGADTIRPVGFAKMLFMRGIVAGWVANIAILFTLGILLFMPFWDKRHQNIWDKVSSTYVVSDPNDHWATKPVLR
jgi:uncharacterized RDD family membrane protein YckC